MKIAFDATALYGRLGGIENALWHTFAGLRALDFENDYLVYVPRDAPHPPLPENPRWQWRRLPFDGADKLRRIIWQQFQLPLWLRREKPNLLHSWNYVAPLLAPLPVVLTVQDLIALDRPRFATPFNRLHYRAIMPQSLRRASRIIVTTPRTQSAVIRRVPNAQVRVVPLGVEPLFLKAPKLEQMAAVRRKYSLPPRFLLFVGNFEPKKNLPNLLRALKLVPEAPPLVLAGGIKSWPEVEKLLVGTQRIGFVDQADLPALYAACNVFCFPSLCEGFGLPVVEALACGGRVLASDQVPLPRLHEVAALCKPHSPSSIAQKLRESLEKPVTPGEEEHRRAYAAQFTWLKTAQKTLDVYRELS